MAIVVTQIGYTTAAGDPQNLVDGNNTGTGWTPVAQNPMPGNIDPENTAVPYIQFDMGTPTGIAGFTFLCANIGSFGSAILVASNSPGTTKAQWFQTGDQFLGEYFAPPGNLGSGDVQVLQFAQQFNARYFRLCSVPGSSGPDGTELFEFQFVELPPATPRVSQLAAEIINTQPTAPRVTTLAAEVLNAGPAAKRVSSVAAEVLRKRYIQFDPSTAVNVTLSNGGLSGTNTSTADATGCKGFAAEAKSAGLLYFEAVGLTGAAGPKSSIGLNTPSTSIANQVSVGGANGGIGLYQGGSGAIFVSGANTFVTAGWLASATDVIGVAVDMTHMKVWFKNITQNRNWNDTVTANPATNVGGVSITATPLVPFFGWGLGGNTGQKMTANFAGPFVGSVPAGFSAWDATAAPETGPLTAAFSDGNDDALTAILAPADAPLSGAFSDGDDDALTAILDKPLLGAFSDGDSDALTATPTIIESSNNLSADFTDGDSDVLGLTVPRKVPVMISLMATGR